jgi:hypothetical protein
MFIPSTIIIIAAKRIMPAIPRPQPAAPLLAALRSHTQQQRRLLASQPTTTANQAGAADDDSPSEGAEAADEEFGEDVFGEGAEP